MTMPANSMEMLMSVVPQASTQKGSSWQDSPTLHRRESNVQDYGMGYGNQGFVGHNPARARPSPVRGHSPHTGDAQSPHIAAFPSNPISGQTLQRRSTPVQGSGPRRQSVDRRGNSPSHGAGTPPSQAPSGDWGYHGRRSKGQGTPTNQPHWAGPPGVGGPGNGQGSPAPHQRSGNTATPEKRNGGQPVEKTPSGKTQLLDEVMAELIDRHVKAASEEALGTIVGAMKKIEAAFWDFLDNYVNEARYAGMHKFERGLLKEFTAEVLKRMPQLCALWPEAPTGGLDCDKGEVNKKKVAELFHRKLCDSKMAEPVAGGVLMDPDLKKILMVKSKLCPMGWTLPKGKVQQLPGGEMETPQQAAIREVFSHTGYAIASKMEASYRLDVVVDRVAVKQTQTLFIIPGITEADIPPVENEISWRPISGMPYLDNVTKKPAQPLKSKAPPEYETVMPFLSKLGQPIAQMLMNLRAGRAPEGPAVPITEQPTHIMNYPTVREQLLKDPRFAGRWKCFGSPAPDLSTKANAQKRTALIAKTYSELQKVLNVAKE